jgi:hypothetical protein
VIDFHFINCYGTLCSEITVYTAHAAAGIIINTGPRVNLAANVTKEVLDLIHEEWKAIIQEQLQQVFLDRCVGHVRQHHVEQGRGGAHVKPGCQAHATTFRRAHKAVEVINAPELEGDARRTAAGLELWNDNSHTGDGIPYGCLVGDINLYSM